MSTSPAADPKSSSEPAAALIPEQARLLIGSEFRRASGVVRKLEFQRWATAVEDLNPLYFDDDYARSMGYREVIAPPMFLPYVTTAVITLDTLNPDGSRGGANQSDIRLPQCPRRVAGGEEWTFHHPVHDSDEISSSRILYDLRQKAGRSGSFVLIVWKTVYTRVSVKEPDLVAVSMTTHVARP
jgi:acyl dehydratase